ncbi:hypothetical protein ACPOL_6805 (plasmid) [Acidisarcina polymorpha]|uniref:DUF2382 domain-containing protein n=1 Tax=Acidisarcina polymorpha TaxID=2211140 RepID=A0A2Z5GBP5_9BACT|nr:YsnF/AvaK domain-containing protein [Acidisarcina polymorpha]AXC16015.1 hypothetical protein ACPOL_6805 [Acidisarcina polymorpha]
MAKTVVGLFANFGKAESVKQALIEGGLSSQSIEVLANEERGSASSTSSFHAAGKNIGEKISSFFHYLGGGDDKEHAYYAKSVTEGGALVAVTVEDEEADEVAELLEEHGAHNVDESNAAAGRGSLARTSGVADSGELSAIPIVEEHLVVGKREVERGGVRVYSRITERPVEAEVALREEHVVVSRRPVNRAATAADFSNVNGDVIELNETVEEAVVGKTSRVVEEVLVGKESTEHTEAVRDTVRHTEVEVEQIPGTETTTKYDR